MPTFNGEKTILRTITSIAKQKYRPLQLIVVDDKSQDSTASLIEDFVRKTRFPSEFNIIHHKSNLGLSRSLNDGVKEARGKYILTLHQDCELVSDNWIEKALSLMSDEKVAVVTGYYGVTDIKDESFVKRAFGVLRKQFHSRPKHSCEKSTFSEGKCDLYRKELLIKVGGFPTGYRIAGEDLIVSYNLRKIGYSIMKCYDLQVIQRFGGPAESFVGNLGKEFLFGKAMGGVFSEFKTFLFKSVNTNTMNYSASRSIHRSSQPLFAFFILAALLAAIFLPWALFLVIVLLGFRFAYYFLRVFPELKAYTHPLSHISLETILTSAIGILTDFFYSFGFVYGLVLHGLRKRL